MAAEYGDREIILANFQSITGIDNLDECITLLDHHNWDLTACVNLVLADQIDSPVRRPEPVVIPDNEPEERLDCASSLPEVIGRSLPLHHPPRSLKFLVEWKDRTIPVVLDDVETVGMIKRMLEMQLDVPTDQQSLMGWTHGQQMADNTVLSSLNLREETTLVLLTPKTTSTPKENQPCSSKAANFNGTSGSCSESIDRVMLHIQHGQREFNLPYPVTKTIGEVKNDTYSLTGIPLRHQCWSGWPDGVTDNMTLREADLSFPVHSFAVSRYKEEPINVQDMQGTSKATSIDVDMEMNCDSSDNEEDTSCAIDEDDIFNEGPCVRKQIREMLPDDSIDTADILVGFTTQFEERYGDVHPHFYMGPLTEAIKEANGNSAKERQPLLIYLHHDGSILTNVFCSQLLCTDTIVNYISGNFVIWAWDMTHDTNRTRFLDVVTQQFGSVAATTVRNFNSEQYPLLLVVMKNRSALEVCSVLQGNLTLDELMTGLMSAHETFTQAMTIEIREEAERNAREEIKREQEEEYQESLRVDRAKAEERKRLEEKDLLARKLQEERNLHEAQLKEAQRLSLMDQLPDEPGPECTEPVSKLRFRLPNGEQLTRRFLAVSPLQVVLTFVQSKGFLDNEYKVVANFPRREISSLDVSQSLQTLGLYPQETFFVEER